MRSLSRDLKLSLKETFLNLKIAVLQKILNSGSTGLSLRWFTESLVTLKSNAVKFRLHVVTRVM